MSQSPRPGEPANPIPPASSPPVREPLYCDCCSKDRGVMAVREGPKLIIRARKHGQRHVLVLDVAAEYDKLRTRQP